MPEGPALIRMIFAVTGALSLAACASGCSFGPRVLEQTHARYSEAIRRVDEEQLLRNIVHIRYNESPFKLTVSSIAAQYELAGAAEARPFFLAPNPNGATFRTFTKVLPDVGISGANRPTMTLIPANGEAIRRYMTPITPETMLFLSKTSWPISTVMRLWAERLNGVPNATSASGPQREFAPDYLRFQRIAHLLQVAQDLELAIVFPEERLTSVGGPLPASAITASAVSDAAKNGMEYRPQGDGGTWVLTRKETKLAIQVNPIAIDHPVLDELSGLLNLRPGLERYDLVVATDIADPLHFPREPSVDLRLTPRSTAQVHFYLANGVEVPPEHVAAGLVCLPKTPDGRPFDTSAVTAGLFSVHVAQGHKPPANAYVAVRYRDYWYYIDERDQATKATFELVLQLSRLDFGLQETTNGPFLTLPVGR
jgi:hypothetical protein